MRDYASLYTLLLADLGDVATVGCPITSDMDSREVAAVALASSFYKKLAPGGNSTDADANALKKFKAINESISSEPFQFLASSEAESCFYDYWRGHLMAALEPREDIGSFDLEYIRNHMGVGPGAAQKADSTYMVSKLFQSSISYMNESLIPIYRSALAETGLWAEAEMQRFHDYGFTKVRGGKLFFAPKNSEISRTCCTEASLEMLIQKAAGAFLEERLEWYFGISLKTQPDFNRELARIGSIHGTFGTMDLVSASDSISTQLMLRDLPRGFLKTMMLASRSERAVLPDGSETVLNMISTMGNGFTFPLQTVIFASAVRAVYQLMGFPSNCPRTQFGVFGDDLIVRTETFEFLARMLAKLGFQVNVGKSFNTGPFRESCGHDYYRGHNVRGVYVKSLETPQEVYSVINRLVRWSVYHGIPLARTIARLMTWIRDIRVPPSESDDSGLHVPWRLSTSTKVSDNYWYKYRCFTRRVRKMQVSEPDDNGVISPLGIGVGYLAGHIRRRELSFTETSMQSVRDQLDAGKPAFGDLDRAASVSIRDRAGARARYKVSTKHIPYWDYWPNTKTADSPRSGYDEWNVSLPRGSQRAWEDALVALIPDGDQIRG